jgi:hypothetical protein
LFFLSFPLMYPRPLPWSIKGKVGLPITSSSDWT